MLNYFKGSVNIDHTSEEWTDAIDRGGLIHVNDMLYMFFNAMEEEVRRNINEKIASEDEGIKETIIQKINDNEDATFYWSLLAVNWETKEATTLREFITRHWVTIRGFSNASACMEKYKQRNKKTTQKSKGLRKNLITGEKSNE